jgi:pSer/pThr/pTyr-binding forkhead associated (FHA) protein
MASLTIPFPEGTRTVTLRGNRITIGRLPDNTIQIRDRTISAYHVELVEEGDHYLLRDKGSTNGVLIGGQRVTDYHLREDCKVNFGGMECEFQASTKEEPVNELDAVPTRSEMLTILQANGDLRMEVAALRSQVDTMLKARETSGSTGQTVPLEQHDQLAAEAAALRATLQERQTQIERLTSMLAIVTRERDSIQKGYDDARAALEKAREAATAETGQAPARASAPTTPTTAPSPVAPGAPRVPTAPSVPGTPKVPVAHPAGTNGVKPAGPSTIVRTPTPTAPASGSGLPKPPGSLGSGSPSRRPASGIQPAVARPPGAAQALVSAGTGPKGTQKLVE